MKLVPTDEQMESYDPQRHGWSAAPVSSWSEFTEIKDRAMVWEREFFLRDGVRFVIEWAKPGEIKWAALNGEEIYPLTWKSLEEAMRRKYVLTIAAVEVEIPASALQDIFTTALEGGVNHWSSCSKYRWENRQPADVYAVIHDSEDDDKEFRVTIDTILLGLQRLISGEAKIHIAEQAIRRMALGVAVDPEDYDYDAGDADNIVQAGLFNEVVYG